MRKPLVSLLAFLIPTLLLAPLLLARLIHLRSQSYIFFFIGSAFCMIAYGVIGIQQREIWWSGSYLTDREAIFIGTFFIVAGLSALIFFVPSAILFK